jgi:predicted ATPase
LLGYPEQALLNRQKAIDLAQEINHSVTTCFSLYLGNFPNFLKPDTVTTQADSVNLLEIAQQHEASVVIGFGKIMHGWVLAHIQNREEGIEEIIEGQDKLKTIGLRLISSLHWLLLLDAYGTSLDVDEGLIILDKDFDYAENSGEKFMLAEMYRLKGNLLLQNDDPEAAEANYEKSLEVARKQSAKWWELRTTTSLAKLWQSQGKTREAHQALSEIYNWFTEGFDMQDMKEAKALLDELT